MLNLLQVNFRSWSKKVPPLEEPVWKIVDCIGFKVNKQGVLEFDVLMPEYFGPRIQIIPIGVTYKIKGYRKFLGLI